jgi:hypothetical protein
MDKSTSKSAPSLEEAINNAKPSREAIEMEEMMRPFRKKEARLMKALRAIYRLENNSDEKRSAQEIARDALITEHQFDNQRFVNAYLEGRPIDG